MDVHTDRLEALGVLCQVTVDIADALERATAILRDEVAALDAACSRFRADSELVALNRDRRAVVSLVLRDALAAALDVAERTDGLVDPTVGGAMRAVGYDRDYALVARNGTRRTIERRPASGWRNVRLDRITGEVELPSGCELDLGASAKALAADRIAARVREECGCAALISLGGDVAVAGTPPTGGWPILVTDSSRDREARGQTVAIASGGLATSSTTVRRWRAGSVELHHIVDPRTGMPASGGWRTASVAAASCLDANAEATAALVIGREAPLYLASRRLSARLIADDGAAITTCGWPAETCSAPAPHNQTHAEEVLSR